MARGQWTQGSGGGLDTSEVTATADQVLKGYTAGVKDSDEPVEGTLEVQSIVNFKVSLYGHLSLTGTWQNPAKGPYSGVMIRYKAGSYPASVIDGSQAYLGSGTVFTVGGLTAGTTYYFRAWAYMTTNYGRMYADGYQQATAVARATRGNKTFTSSGSFTVPSGVTSIDLFCVGGGGSGGTGGGWDWWGGDGGNGGYTKTVKKISVSPGQVLQITVGGEYGESSVIRSGVTLCLTEGSAGTNGGSGGGAGDVLDRDGRQDPDKRHRGGDGGSNGSDGTYSSRGRGYPGKGQGTTTRAFGESSGTLYAGGGAGAAYYGGKAGAGGGGHPEGGNGTNGAGGGGGGAALVSGGRGGSGAVLIRWGY